MSVVDFIKINFANYNYQNNAMLLFKHIQDSIGASSKLRFLPEICSEAAQRRNAGEQMREEGIRKASNSGSLQVTSNGQ